MTRSRRKRRRWTMSNTAPSPAEDPNTSAMQSATSIPSSDVRGTDAARRVLSPPTGRLVASVSGQGRSTQAASARPLGLLRVSMVGEDRARRRSRRGSAKLQVPDLSETDDVHGQRVPAASPHRRRGLARGRASDQGRPPLSQHHVASTGQATNTPRARAVARRHHLFHANQAYEASRGSSDKPYD